VQLPRQAERELLTPRYRVPDRGKLRQSLRILKQAAKAIPGGPTENPTTPKRMIGRHARVPQTL